MMMQKLLASALDFVRGLESAMDYDPVEAQGRRLAILERKFDEVAGRFRDGVAVPKPSIESAKFSIEGAGSAAWWRQPKCNRGRTIR